MHVKILNKDFEDKHQFPNTKFATNINNYIQNKIIPILKLNNFEGEYPYFIYKDYKKIYIISFEIKENKVVIKYDDKDKSNPKINLSVHSAVLSMAAVRAGERRRQTKKPQRYHISEACKYHSPISICRHLIADT